MYSADRLPTNQIGQLTQSIPQKKEKKMTPCRSKTKFNDLWHSYGSCEKMMNDMSYKPSWLHDLSFVFAFLDRTRKNAC